jgi:hypothetical protein
MSDETYGGAAAGQSFYRLGFASQLIVWATRKRLHLLASGDDDSKVAQAFRLARLESAHGALMSIVDVLTCGASNRILLHAVACPCLSPHEVGLLNALAHLQSGRAGAAAHRLERIMGAAAARLVLPALLAIVAELDSRGLRVAPIGDGPRLLSSVPAIGASIH